MLYVKKQTALLPSLPPSCFLFVSVTMKICLQSLLCWCPPTSSATPPLLCLRWHMHSLTHYIQTQEQMIIRSPRNIYNPIQVLCRKFYFYEVCTFSVFIVRKVIILLMFIIEVVVVYWCALYWNVLLMFLWKMPWNKYRSKAVLLNCIRLYR